jgi:hypothetical protein
MFTMKRNLIFTLLLVCFTFLSGHASLYINEVNSDGKWIELYNDGNEGIDVGGYTVTRNNNDGATGDAIIPAGAVIASKGFLVIFQGTASGGTAPSPVAGAIDCMPFGISAAKFMSAVLKDDQGSVVDNTFDIGNPQTVIVSGIRSWGRATDGGAVIVALDPTPGKSNVPPTPSTLKIYINEVNSDGKWIELYNDENEGIDVGKYTVTRNNNDGATGVATIPAGATIASKGFLVIFQGPASGGTASSPVEGAIDCMPYGISATKFMNAILKDNQGSVVDNTFDIGNPQTVTVSGLESWARETDGGAVIVALDPTPGISNVPFSDSKVYVNEVNSDGKWIELYNSGNTEVNVGGYTVTRYNNDGAIGDAIIPAGTTIASKGFLVIFQGPASGGTASSPVEGAIDCMPYGISAAKFMSAILKSNIGEVIDGTFDIGNPQEVIVSGMLSWARKTDGAIEIVPLEPTPGKSNTSTPPGPSDLKIYINEVNSTGKWIELYNDEDQDINVGWFTVTRNNNDGATSKATIPAGTTIASKGFLVIYQGVNSGGTATSPVEGAIDCMPYGISSDKFENAILKDNNGSIVDNTFDLGYPQSVTVSGGKSWGRQTDGGAVIAALDPTPGISNTSSIGPCFSDLKIYINEVNSDGKWIEFYNDEDQAEDIGLFTVTRNNNDGATSMVAIPEGTVIASKGFLVIYQGVNSGGTAPSPVEGAIDCLTYGISATKFMNAILKDVQGCIVDNTFDIGNPQEVIVSGTLSWARETDGATNIVALTPTPGARNDQPYSIKESKTNNISVFVYAEILNLPEKTSNIQLYGISGNLVLSRNTTTTTSIDLTNLPKGFYIVKLMVSGESYTQKIILN